MQRADSTAIQQRRATEPSDPHELHGEHDRVTRKFVLANASTIALSLLISMLAYLLAASTKEFAGSLLVQATGIAVGWLLGFLASPYTSSEKSAFSDYAKVLAAFLGGYVLSKTDELVKYLVDPNVWFSQPLVATRIMLFVASTIIAAISMYVFRAYLDPNEPGVRGREVPPAGARLASSEWRRFLELRRRTWRRHITLANKLEEP